MINIQAVYGKYDELIAEFGEQEIQEQISKAGGRANKGALMPYE